MKQWVISTLMLVGLIACCLTGCAKDGGKLAQSSDIHYDMSVEMFRKGDLGNALREVQLALEVRPTVAIYWNMLGIIYFAQHNMEKAEEAFKTALMHDEGFSEAYNNLGSLYIELKKWELADYNFKAALKNPLYINPEKAYTNLGYVYFRLGRMDDAVKMFRQALSFNSGFYLANIHLGRIAFEQKRYEVASQYLKKGVENCAECQEAQFKLGISYLKLDRPDDAKKVFESGFKYGSQSFYSKKCREYYDILAKGEKVELPTQPDRR